jgi:hypothetical protein
MKKTIYILAIALFSALTFSACTEEEVAPTSTTTAAGGGGGIADKMK